MARTCPNCGIDLTSAKRLVAVSARDLVESLRFEQVVEWCSQHIPTSIDALEEFEAFRDRMRASGYKTNAGPVKDAAAAFRTHMRNAVKFARPRTVASKPVRNAVARKEL